MDLIVRYRESVRYHPAHFGVRSDRSRRDDWFDESAVHLIHSKSMVGGGTCGSIWAKGGVLAFRASPGSGKRSRSATPTFHISTGLPGKFAGLCNNSSSGAALPEAEPGDVPVLAPATVPQA